MEDIFLTLSESNGVPSAVERGQIVDFLRDCRTELGTMRVEMENHRRQRVSLVMKMQKCMYLLAPIRRLTRDVLQEIFLHCLPDKHNSVMSIREAPLILTLVCTTWRDVALQTPSLWTSIHIVVPFRRTNSRVPAYLEAVKRWLTRSRSLPITISLGMERYPPSMSIFGARRLEDYTEDFLRCAAEYRDRWENVTLPRTSIPDIKALIEGTSSDMIVDNPGETRETFPMLRSLRVLSEIGLDRLRIFYDAPKLERLELPFCTSPMKLPIHWDRLTSIDLTIPTSNVLRILRLCTNLRDAVIRCERERVGPMHIYMGSLSDSEDSDDMTDVDSMPYNVELPHLHTFAIRGTLSPEALSALNFPSLRSLKCFDLGIATPGVMQTPNVLSIASVMPNAALEEVSAAVRKGVRQDLLEYLRQHPDLKRVRLHDSHLPPSLEEFHNHVNAGLPHQNPAPFFNANNMDDLKPAIDNAFLELLSLHDSNEHEVLLPNLEEFEVFGCGKGFTIEAWTKFAVSRKGKLQRMTLSYDQPVSKDNIKSFGELQQLSGLGKRCRIIFPIRKEIPSNYSPYDGLIKDEASPRWMGF